MNKWKTAYRLGMICLVAAALVSGWTSALALIPEPDCGPSRLWVCVVPGCDTCPDILFAGTICEKLQFEEQTGRVCSPF